MLYRNRKSAFTLVELIVTMGIMSIVFLLGYTPIKTFKEHKENIEFRDTVIGIKNFIHINKAYAKQRNTTLELLVDLNNNRILCMEESKIIDEIILDKKYKFDGNSTTKLYLYNGYGEEKGGRISVKNNNDKSKTISIRAVTGFVELKE